MERYFNKRNFLILLTVLLFLIAWNRAINLLYGMFALVGAVLIFSHIMPRYVLGRIYAARFLPPSAFEDDEIEIEVRVENRGWANRYMVEVVDSIPAAEPHLRHPMTFVAKLPGRKRREYILNLICDRRGEHKIGPLTLRSAYPLGITSMEKLLPENLPTLLVYPRVFEIASLPLIGGSQAPMSGVEAISKAGGSEDFFGTREYRDGDSLKYIHWPSTARHAELIVKEFEITASTEVTLILDLHKDSCIGKGKHSTLEYAVKVAASIARYALQRGHYVQLAGYGERPHLVLSSSGYHQWAMILEELARVEADGDVPYSRAICQATELIRDGGTAVLLFSRADCRVEEYLNALGLLKAKRVRLLCVLMEARSFLGRTDRVKFSSDTLVQKLAGEGVPMYFISRDDDLQEVFSR